MGFGPFDSSHELLLQKCSSHADANLMRKGLDSGDAALCPSCDGPREQWFTTCPTCDFPFELGPNAILSHQVAAPLTTGSSFEQWIDVPIGSDQPAKAALLRAFLADQGFEFEESRRFVSFLVADVPAIEAALMIWAYHQDLPEDHRHLDTLMSTLKEIGDETIAAIHSVTLAPTASGLDRAAGLDDEAGGGNDLDLR